MVKQCFAVSAAALLLSACTQGAPEIGTAGGTMVVAEALPEPAQTGPGGGRIAFKLGADDLVAIKVFGSEEASVPRLRIDKSGRLSVPIAGVIDASGLSLEELEAEIERRLRANFFRQPQVSVNLLEIESARVTVDGQVMQPGVYPAIPDMTLLQAVASARGTTESARLNEVVIFRTVEGRRYAALYDLREIRRGNYADPRIYANDIITIGDSSARRLFRDFISVIPLLTTPLIVAFQN
jgi:polysaccharide export outer membrane protein